jgi:hypothetical protein
MVRSRAHKFVTALELLERLDPRVTAGLRFAQSAVQLLLFDGEHVLAGCVAALLVGGFVSQHSQCRVSCAILPACPPARLCPPLHYFAAGPHFDVFTPGEENFTAEVAIIPRTM